MASKDSKGRNPRTTLPRGVYRRHARLILTLDPLRLLWPSFAKAAVDRSESAALDPPLASHHPLFRVVTRSPTAPNSLLFSPATRSLDAMHHLSALPISPADA